MYYTIPISRQISSPKVIQSPNNLAFSVRQNQLNNAPNEFNSSENSSYNNPKERLESLIMEIEKKNIVCQQKEKEIKYWQQKYSKISSKDNESNEITTIKKEKEKNIESVLNEKENELAEKKIELEELKHENDQLRELTDSYDEKITKLLTENEKLNQICIQRLEQNNIIMVELDSLKLELKEKSMENDLLRDKNSNNSRININNSQLRSELEMTKEHLSNFEEKIKILLIENEKLNDLLNEKVSDVNFWKERMSAMQENSEQQVGELKKQLNLNLETSIKIEKQTYNYEIETLKNAISNLESQNKVLELDKENAIKLMEDLNSKYFNISSKVENYQMNFIDKSIYYNESNEHKTRIQQLESHISNLLLENNKLLLLHNNLKEEIELATSRYENLEKNHAEHIKQLKKNWELSLQNNMELNLREKTFKLNRDVQNLELEADNQQKYIASLEEKNNEALKTINFLNQRLEIQKKNLIKLESEKERVDIYQAKLREIEEKHLEELEQQKKTVIMQIEAERNEELFKKNEDLNEDCNRLQCELDDRNLEIEDWRQKLDTYEQFHLMKVNDLQRQIEEIRIDKEKTKDNNYYEMENKIMFMHEEKSNLLHEIENWRNKCNDLEKKMSNYAILENKMEILGSQNSGLSQNMNAMLQENMQLKEQVLELGKMGNYFYDMENKMKFLIAENERLNRIIINRCKEMLNY